MAIFGAWRDSPAISALDKSPLTEQVDLKLCSSGHQISYASTSHETTTREVDAEDNIYVLVKKRDNDEEDCDIELVSFVGQHDDPITTDSSSSCTCQDIFNSSSSQFKSFSMPDIAQISNFVMLTRSLFYQVDVISGSNQVPILVSSDSTNNQNQSQLNILQRWLNGVFGSWNISYKNLRDMRYMECGTEGFVYVAKLNNEPVAVKKMRNRSDAQTIAHLRKLNHPNVVALKGVCTQDSNFCLVMEYCSNGPLFEFLKQCDYDLRCYGRILHPSLMIEWARQIAAGMEYLHRHRIIHRDLKSPNILISRDDVLKISDLATSKVIPTTDLMTFTGTVAWMAPEMIRHEHCSDKIDVWSFGVVLWELFTLEIPYREFDQSAILFGVGSATLQLPLPKTLPKTFRRLMKQCWNTVPHTRPSFGTILEQITTALPEYDHADFEDYRERQLRWKSDVCNRKLYSLVETNNNRTFIDSLPIYNG